MLRHISQQALQGEGEWGIWMQLPTISPITSAWETDWIWIMHLAVLYCTQPDFVCFICTDLKEDISKAPCKANATVLFIETLWPLVKSQKKLEVFWVG